MRVAAFLRERISAARLGAAVVAVCVLALSAEGDVAGWQSISGGTITTQNKSGSGFSYSEWLQNRHSYTPANAESATGTSAGITQAPGSFWGEVAERLAENVIERTRGSLLGVIPQDGEVRDLLVKYGNGEDLDMAQWREIRKQQLQAALRDAPIAFYADSERALADALSQTAVERLGFVRRARIDWRTSLGGRVGNVAIDAAGGLRESRGDILGWQLRAFGTESKNVGGNTGIFYRRIVGAGLAGANLFLDYEDTEEDGEFWRWSLGGEYKSRYGEISANHYWAITEGKRLENGGYVYSRDGYDVEIAARVPRVEWLKARLGYYSFAGEYGDTDDESLRLGLDMEPGGGLVVGVEYDRDSGDFGGNIAFQRNFGEPLRSAANAGVFDPRAHFYDVVRREYTQRITRTDQRGDPFGAFLITSQVSVYLRAPAVAAITASGNIPASPSFVSLLAAISPGPPFTINNTTTAADRYAFRINRPSLTISTGGGSGNAIIRHQLDAWVLTLNADGEVAFYDSGATLSITRGSGVIDRIRPQVISAVISDRATLILVGTRVGFTTAPISSLIAGSTDSTEVVIFHLRGGMATIMLGEALVSNDITANIINIQNGATAIVIDDAGMTITMGSCADVGATIVGGVRYACAGSDIGDVDLENPSRSFYGLDDNGRVVIPFGADVPFFNLTMVSSRGIMNLLSISAAFTSEYSAQVVDDVGGALVISPFLSPITTTTGISNNAPVVVVSDDGYIQVSVVPHNTPPGNYNFAVDVINENADIPTRINVPIRVLPQLVLASPRNVTLFTERQGSNFGVDTFITAFASGGFSRGAIVANILTPPGGSQPLGIRAVAIGDGTVGLILGQGDSSGPTPAVHLFTLEAIDSIRTFTQLVITLHIIDPQPTTLDVSRVNPVVATSDVFVPAGEVRFSGGSGYQSGRNQPKPSVGIVSLDDIAGIDANISFDPDSSRVITYPRCCGVSDIVITVGRVLLISVQANIEATFTLSVFVDDPHPRVPNITVTRIITTSPGLVLPLPSQFADGYTLTSYGGSAVPALVLPGVFRGETQPGFQVQGYRLLNNFGGILGLRAAGGGQQLVYNAIPAAGVQVLAVSIEVRDNSPQNLLTSTPDRATAIFNINIVNPPPIQVSNPGGQDAGGSVNIRTRIGAIAANGGFVRTDNDWQFSVIPADVGAELAPTQSGNRNGRILYYTARTAATITVSIRADDYHNATPPGELAIVLTAIPLPLGADVQVATVVGTSAGNQNIDIGAVRGTGGLAPYTYTRLFPQIAPGRTFAVGEENGRVVVQIDRLQLYTMSIRIADSHADTPDYDFGITISGIAGLVLPNPFGNNGLDLTTFVATVLQGEVVARGGVNLSYSLLDNFGGLLRLQTFPADGTNEARASIIYNQDSATNPRTITASIVANGNRRATNEPDSATIGFPIRITDPQNVEITLLDGPGPVLFQERSFIATISAIGGYNANNADYTYRTNTPAGVVFSRGLAGQQVLYYTAPVGATTLSIFANDSHRNTPEATLTLHLITVAPLQVIYPSQIASRNIDVVIGGIYGNSGAAFPYAFAQALQVSTPTQAQGAPDSCAVISSPGNLILAGTQTCAIAITAGTEPSGAGITSPTSLPFIMRLEKDGLQTFATITINFVNPDPIVGEFIYANEHNSGLFPPSSDGLAGNMGTLTIGGGFFPPGQHNQFSRNSQFSITTGGDGNATELASKRQVAVEIDFAQLGRIGTVTNLIVTVADDHSTSPNLVAEYLITIYRDLRLVSTALPAVASVGTTTRIFDVTPMDGVLRFPTGYRVTVIPDDIGARVDGGALSRNLRGFVYAPTTAATLTATVIASDLTDITPDASLIVILTASPQPLGVDISSLRTVIGTGALQHVGDIMVTGGLAPYQYFITGQQDVNWRLQIGMTTGRLSAQFSAEGIRTISIRITDAHESTPNFEFGITFSANAGIILDFPANFADGITVTTDGRNIRNYTLNLGDVSGAQGSDFTYSIVNTFDGAITIDRQSGALRWFGDSRLYPESSIPGTLTISVLATGTDMFNMPSTVTRSFRIIRENYPPLTVGVIGEINRLMYLDSTEEVSVLTLTASGGVPRDIALYIGIAEGCTSSNVGFNFCNAYDLGFNPPFILRVTPSEIPDNVNNMPLITLIGREDHPHLAPATLVVSLTALARLQPAAQVLTLTAGGPIDGGFVLITLSATNDPSAGCVTRSNTGLAFPANMVWGTNCQVAVQSGMIPGGNNNTAREEILGYILTSAITGTDPAQYRRATASITVEFVAPPSLEAVFNLNAELGGHYAVPIAGEVVGTLSVSGGYLRDGNYDLNANVGGRLEPVAGITEGTAVIFRANSRSQPVDLNLIFTADDDHSANPPIQIRRGLTIYAPLDLQLISPNLEFSPTAADVQLGILRPSGGVQPYNLQTPAGGTVQIAAAVGGSQDRILTMPSQYANVGGDYTIRITLADSLPTTDDVVFTATVEVKVPLEGQSRAINVIDNIMFPIAGTAVATLGAIGGEPPYTYTLIENPDDFYELHDTNNSVLVLLGVADGEKPSELADQTTPDDIVFQITDSESGIATATITANYGPPPPVGANIVFFQSVVLQGQNLRPVLRLEMTGGYNAVGLDPAQGYRLGNATRVVGANNGNLSVEPEHTNPVGNPATLIVAYGVFSVPDPKPVGLITLEPVIEDNHTETSDLSLTVTLNILRALQTNPQTPAQPFGSNANTHNILTINASGGNSIYAHSILGTDPFDNIAGADFRIANGIGIVESGEGGGNLPPLTTTLTIRTSDSSGITTPVEDIIAITIIPPPPPLETDVQRPPNGGAFESGSGRLVILTINASGGEGTYTYSIVDPSPFVILRPNGGVVNGVFSLLDFESSGIPPLTTTVTIRTNDASHLTPAVDDIVALTIITPPPALDLQLINSRLAFAPTAAAVNVGTLRTSGGLPPYNLQLVGGTPPGVPSDNGTFALALTPGNPGNPGETVVILRSDIAEVEGRYTASVIVMDNYDLNDDITLEIVVDVADALGGIDKQVDIIDNRTFIESGGEVLTTLEASGGTPPYTFSLTESPNTYFVLTAATLYLREVGGGLPNFATSPTNIVFQVVDSETNAATATATVMANYVIPPPLTYNIIASNTLLLQGTNDPDIISLVVGGGFPGRDGYTLLGGSHIIGGDTNGQLAINNALSQRGNPATMVLSYTAPATNPPSGVEIALSPRIIDEHSEVADITFMLPISIIASIETELQIPANGGGFLSGETRYLILTVNASGGEGAYSYAVVGTNPFDDIDSAAGGVNNSGVFEVFNFSGAGQRVEPLTTTLTIRTDDASDLTPAVDNVISITIIAPLETDLQRPPNGGTFEAGRSPYVILTINASGGEGAYTHEIVAPNPFAILRPNGGIVNGVFTLLDFEGIQPLTTTLTIRTNDASDLTPAVDNVISITVNPPPPPPIETELQRPPNGSTFEAGRSPYVILTINASGGEGAYTHEIVAPNPFAILRPNGGIVNGVFTLLDFEGIQPLTTTLTIRTNDASDLTPAVDDVISITVNPPPPININAKTLAAAGLVGQSNFRAAYSLSVSGGSDSGYGINIIDTTYVDSTGPISSPADSNAAGTRTPVQNGESVLSVNASQAGTVRFVVIGFDDNNATATISLTTFFFNPIGNGILEFADNSNVRGSLFIATAGVARQQAIDFFNVNLPAGSAPESGYAGFTRAIIGQNERILTFSNAANITVVRALQATESNANAGIAIGEVIIRNQDIPEFAFRQAATITATAVVVSAAMNASLITAAGLLNPAGESTIGVITVSLGIADFTLGSITVIGITDTSLTTRIITNAADYSIFIDAAETFTTSIIVRELYLGDEIFAKTIGITGNIPVQGLNVGFATGTTPNTVFLINYTGTVGILTAEPELMTGAKTPLPIDWHFPPQQSTFPPILRQSTKTAEAIKLSFPPGNDN